MTDPKRLGSVRRSALGTELVALQAVSQQFVAWFDQLNSRGNGEIPRGATTNGPAYDLVPRLPQETFA